MFVDKITEIGRDYILALTSGELNNLPGITPIAGQSLFAGGIQISYQLSRVARRLFIKGEIIGDLALQCSRCLAPLVEHLQESFTLTLNLVEVEAPLGEELELDAEQINSILPVDGEVDLLPVLQEQILMLLPTHPLCSEMCSGLCPHCGGDRNLNVCDCEPKPFNNRFGKLKDIKIDRS